MKAKPYIIFGFLVLSILSFVYATAFGYTHLNGSEVLYEDGKIIGIHDEVQKQSRYSNFEEVKQNDYIPMSYENNFKECPLN